jgi:hypothetical protein
MCCSLWQVLTAEFLGGRSGGALHEYSFFPAPKNTKPTVYGSADVLHVLYGVNQLNLSAMERGAWWGERDRGFRGLT